MTPCSFFDLRMCYTQCMKDRNFDGWNEEKKKINNTENPTFYIKPRQIWFTKMGENIGSEQNGKQEFSRPVLVLKKVGSLFFTVALTTKEKPNNSFYRKLKDVKLNEDHLKNIGKSSVILSQVRVMDKRRFLEKVGTVGKDEFKDIKEKLIALLL